MTDGAAAPRLIFHAGPARYALPASAVREVARLPRLTPVPLAPPGLLGLGTVRGETLAVLSPQTLTGNTDDAKPRQLLVLAGTTRAALAIDRIERIEREARAEEVSDLALDELLTSAFPIREAARRAGARGATQVATEAQTEAQIGLLRFTIGDQSFALPLEEIEEVLRLPDAIARLPGSDAAVIGTIAHRDGALGILSLAALLGLREANSGAQRRILIARLGTHRLGLLVDRVEGLLHVAASRIDPVPPTLLRGESEASIRAICRPGKGGLVSLLAAELLLSEARTRRLLLTTGDRRDEVARTDERVGRLAILPVGIGGHRLAFPLAAIQRVAPRPAKSTRVPGAPAWLAGLSLVGGESIPIVDQVLRLTEQPASGQRQRLLVVGAGNGRIGFLVDRVDAIIQADRALLEAAPLPQALAAGIYGDALRLEREEDGALLLLEPEALISSAERDLVAALARTGSQQAQ